MGETEEEAGMIGCGGKDGSTNAIETTGSIGSTSGESDILYNFSIMRCSNNNNSYVAL